MQRKMNPEQYTEAVVKQVIKKVKKQGGHAPTVAEVKKVVNSRRVGPYVLEIYGKYMAGQRNGSPSIAADWVIHLHDG